MKKIILAFFVLASFSSYSQGKNYGYKWSTKDRADYYYLNTSFDVNKAFHIRDNRRTEIDKFGLDVDIEAGVRDNHVGIYIFYGRFDAMDWQNHGAGIDYYVHWLRESKIYLYNPFTGEQGLLFNGIDMSIGVAYGEIILDNNFSFSGNHARAVATFWITDNIGITGRLQYTQRGDLPNKFGIIEGSVGATFTINR